MSLVSTNPATGETLNTYGEMSSETVDAVLESAQLAWLGWRERSFAERAAPMRRAAQALRDRRGEYAELMAAEMGKPVTGGRAEAEKCAWVCDYYAEHAEAFLSPRDVATEASHSFVAFEPLGVLLGVMPWNYPFWEVVRFAAPALMAGNAVVFKHASNVTGCALRIEALFDEAGFPSGLCRSLLIPSGRIASIIDDPRVASVTLTGSTEAGRAVAARAGQAIKKSILELGGSDPYVILADADLDAAVATCVTSRLINSGQSCVAAKRFIVVEELAGDFERKFTEAMKMKKMGNPLDEDTEVGPQARADLRDELHEQVRKSVALGARVLLGGTLPDGPGSFYPPTVLAGVKKGMPAYDEELFGPVAAIIAAKDEDDAIRMANDNVYGLGAAVFTRDVKRGEAIAAKRLQAGLCFVNGYVKSDPRLPFGGTKLSGYGRALAEVGIRELVNIKTVHVR